MTPLLQKSAAAAILFVSPTFISPAALAQTYTISDLGALGGPTSSGFALNNAGHVVGVATRADAHTHAFLWTGSIFDVPPLSGDLESNAFGITSDDRLVAASYDLGEVIPHGYLWQNNVSTSLGNIAPRAITDSGIVVGSTTLLDSSYGGWADHAARWINGSLLDLGTLGGHSSYAYSATEDGRIVGVSFLANDSTRRAFLWQSGIFHDLGTLGGTSSQAYSINEVNDVVGWAETSTSVAHAFLYKIDVNSNVISRTDLGHLGNNYSAAYAVNASHEVVGTSSSHAFIWRNGVMQDLNTLVPAKSGWRLDTAWDINDSGQIVGTGVLLGFPRAFLLTPHVCPDLNGDGQVNILDLTSIILAWNTSDPTADINSDGVVNILDLTAVILAWGTCP